MSDRNTVHFTADIEELSKRTVRAMSGSGRFWLSARGVILFEVAADNFVGLAREAEIESVLGESTALQWIGQSPSGEALRLLARAVVNRRWMLKPASLRPSRTALGAK